MFETIASAASRIANLIRNTLRELAEAARKSPWLAVAAIAPLVLVW